MNAIKSILQPVRNYKAFRNLPENVKIAVRADRRSLQSHDPGAERVTDEGIGWLFRAQDHSLSRDGGIARHFSVINGWAASYPETTGYIIPTLLEYSTIRENEEASKRARKMLDWLVSIQMPCGAFQGGIIGCHPIVPVTFNTGQILLGLAAGVRVFGDDYRGALIRAADWLADTQSTDGCWRDYPSPFTKPGEKTYDTHVAWGLFQAAQLMPEKAYGQCGLRNLQWAIRFQRPNGWFDNCCLENPPEPTEAAKKAAQEFLKYYGSSLGD